MSTPDFYMLKYACPLFIRDTDRDAPQIVGAAVPIRAGKRGFLITAAHVADYMPEHHLLYPTDKGTDDLVGFADKFIGAMFTTASESASRLDDKYDFAFLEIDPAQLSQKFSFVPPYMIEKNFHLGHVDRITLLGYPASKNKPRYRRTNHLLKSIAFDMRQVNHEEYFTLGLDPIRHFCVRFDPKKATGEDGKNKLPPDPHGMSGGPAWHITEVTKATGTDEGAVLLGIVSEHDVINKVIWGARISYIIRHLIKLYPELEPVFNLPRQIRVTKPEDVRLWNRVKDA